jgi:cytochrome c oxidase subunit 3
MAEAHAQKHHDYHLVNPSPWPVVGSISVFLTAIGLIVWMRSMGGGEGLFGLRGPSLFAVGCAGILFTMFMWWRDVIKEAHGGDHTPVVQLHLRYGMILFIASEVMFFVAWFWAYFDAALFPAAVHPLEVTTSGGTVEATKEVIGMV